jgi:hypothetical protein
VKKKQCWDEISDDPACYTKEFGGSEVKPPYFTPSSKVMRQIYLIEVISHSRKGKSREGYISGTALKVYDDCQRRYLSGGNLPHT